MPNARVPAAAVGLPSSSRRRLLLGAAAATVLLVEPVAADSTPHPDAALLAREPALLRLTASLVEAVARNQDVESLAFDLARVRSSVDEDDWYEVLEAAHVEVGSPATEEALMAAYDALEPEIEAAAAARALTFDGLRLKARFAEHSDLLAASIVADLLASTGGSQA